MQKYLLLLLMCLVGMIEAQAGIKVTSAGSGSYILTFTNTTTGTTYDWNSLDDNENANVKSATSLKIITEGDYKLSEDDVAHIMGAIDGDYPYSWFPTSFKQLKSLDMSDAEIEQEPNKDSFLKYMKAARHNGPGLTQLTSFTFPKTTKSIPEEMFMDNTTIQEVIMLECDDTNLSAFTTIPDKAFMNATNLTSVRIPEGVTLIGTSAFAGESEGKAPKLAFIHFPNTLQRIEYDAFVYNSELTSVTIPANVNYIGDNAFQKNEKLEDVYVLGSHVETFDGSFNQEYTYEGFTYDDVNDGNIGKVSINDWKSKKSYVKHPARLHFPNDPEAYKYCVNPFLRALNDLTLDELRNLNTEETRKKLNSYGIKTDDMGKLDMFASDKWVVMDGYRYFKNDEGLFNSYCELLDTSVANGDPNYTAFNGWHNFMFAAGDLEEKIWPDGRLVDSRWYSAVFPFSMSYNQVMTTYGVGTDVREFTYVNKHIVDGQERRTVTFSTKPTIPDNDRNKEGYITKGIPYMIHPGVRSVDPNATRSSGKTIPRSIAGVDVKAANNVINNEATIIVKGDLVDGNKPLRGSGYEIITPQAYTFRGSYKDGDIPANSFYLGYDPNDPIKWPLAFYVTKKTLVGKWTAFTSIVQKVDANATSQAKTMDLGFSELFSEDFGITTEIEQIPVIENRCESNIVFNLNGQVVRENNASVQGLSKGIYVVNGKKIVVR